MSNPESRQVGPVGRRELYTPSRGQGIEVGNDVDCQRASIRPEDTRIDRMMGFLVLYVVEKGRRRR